MNATKPPPEARAWLEVDLAALIANARSYADRAGAPLLPMVKADAYGLGAVAVSRALEQVEPWGYGVATVEEGEALRAAGIARPIVMLSPLLASEVSRCAEAGLRPTLGDLTALRAWLALDQLPFHVELDAGMHRGGFPVEDAETLAGLASLLAGAPGWEGAWCQFHSADTDPATVGGQWTRFLDALDRLGRRPPMVHGANSAAGLAGPLPGATLARPGIYLYGGDVGGPAPLPVVSLRSRVVGVRRVRPGDTVSYGATWTADRATTVATLAAGYADGIPLGHSSPEGRVLLHGRMVPVAGRVTMDMTMADVGDLPVVPGDIGTFIGGALTLEDQAARAGTTSYQLLTGIGPRVVRSYSDPESDA